MGDLTLLLHNSREVLVCLEASGADLNASARG